MNPVTVLRKLFCRQEPASRTKLESLYGDERGLAVQQAKVNYQTGEEKVLYGMALVFMSWAGLRTKSLIDMMTTSYKKLKLDANIGFTCPFDPLFAEVAAFYLFAAIQDYWKDNEREYATDEESEDYNYADDTDDADNYYASILYSLRFADGILKAISNVSPSGQFVDNRVEAYSSAVRQKENVHELFTAHLLNRMFPNNPNDILCLDRTLMAPFCMAFSVSSNTEGCIKGCKQMYRELTSEPASTT